jgi:hypothetical protein
VVVDLIGLSEKLSTQAISYSVADKGGSTEEDPLIRSQLSIFQISENSWSSSEKSSQANTYGTNLAKNSTNTTFSSQKLILSKEMLFWVVDDLISSIIGDLIA